jgi:hypothetical protein
LMLWIPGHGAMFPFRRQMGAPFYAEFAACPLFR